LQRRLPDRHREQARSHIQSHFFWKNSVECGSGLAREEAIMNTTQTKLTKKARIAAGLLF
jgi:hypothetical protein